jgi:phospholipid-binding lipoprotein MlaA
MGRRFLILSGLLLFPIATALFPLSAKASEPVVTAPKTQQTPILTLASPYDPIEGLNRCFFEFNDAFMLWLIRPLEKVYSFILPKTARTRIDMIIVNFEFIIRGVSCLLEGEFNDAWVVTERFFINLTLGVAGIFDVADDWFDLHPRNEDFGQAFATWGIGPGFYFVIPILGPSTFRDAIGEIFFFAFHPVTWLPIPGIGLFVFVNRASLRIGPYMDTRAAAFDKYATMRDLWYINRLLQIDNLDRIPEPSPDAGKATMK